VGFPDQESALNGYNNFIELSPLFLALSASSPFFRGKDTGLLSYRSKLFEQLPRAGAPQQFSTYQEYCELVELLKESGTIESLKDVWWDVRLRPDLGTVELRICDSVGNLGRIRGLLNLAVMVGALSLSKPLKPYYHQVHLQNRWNAARHGLEGKFIDRGRSLSLGQKLLEVVSEFGKRFGSLKEGARLLERLTTEPLPAQVQLSSYKRSSSLKSAVKVSLLEG